MSYSPEVLRAFYLIAITKDPNPKDSLADSDQRGTVPLPTLRRRSPRCEPAQETDDEAALNKEQDIVNLEVNLGHAEGGAAQLRSFLKNSRVSWNDSACQQCRLHDLYCDLQRPSCWKCQRYDVPCNYEHEGETSYQQDEVYLEPEAEPISWQDSVRDNPYHNLEGDGKLYRIDRRYSKPRRSRLSKPIRREKKVLYQTEGGLKNDKEELLGRVSPSISEHDMESRTTSPTRSERDMASRTASSTKSEVDAESRTISPNDWVESEPVRWFSRPNSCCGSRYTSSFASTESSTTGSSPRHSFTIRTTPPTTGASSTWLPPMPPSNDTPRPFQCTFCLYQCEDQDEWELHELLEHWRIWTCMPWGPVENTDGHNVCVFCGVSDPGSDHFQQHETQHCYRKKRKDRTFRTKDALQRHLAAAHNQTEMSHRMQKWSRSPKDKDLYWICGFCEAVLPRWGDRVEHIGIHFNEGTVMSSWDPLKPPHPLDRRTLNRVAWFPPLGWDERTLWDLERKRRGFSWTHDVLEEQFRCQDCDTDVYFGSEEDVKRHKDIWHNRREVWSCPTIYDIENGILAPYFFPTNIYASLPNHRACPYCDKSFERVAESYPDLDPWEARLQHLELNHKFDGCEPVCKSTNPDFILLHLANIHHVTLNDKTGEVVESCRKDERPLAKKINIPTVK